MLKDFPSRVFESKFDKTLKKIPALGKLISSLFGLFEFYILETFRKLDNVFNIYTMGFINKYVIRGRWGGRVVPLNKNISIDVKFIPSQEILEILNRSKVVGIGECYCRAVQRKHENDNCDHPLHTCIHFGPGKSLYEIPFKSTNLKRVTKKEINQLLDVCDERGLLHQLIYFPNPQFYYIVCNCCPCCCVVLSKFLEKGSPQMIKSDFITETDDTKCVHCGNCIKECHFKARYIRSSLLKFDSTRCFGCGLCVSKCPHQAIELIKKE